MSRIIASIALVLSLLLIPFAIASNNQPAQAAPLVGCVDHVHARSVNVVCQAAGVTVLNIDVPRPVVQVTVPPVRITTTVTAPPIPGPTHTVTVHVTRTVPGATQTIVVDKTIRATATKTATATATHTVNPVGHPVTSHGTLGPTHKTSHPGPIIKIGGGPVQKAALGIGVLIVASILALLGVFLGYYLGYQDSERNEARFLKSLLVRNKKE